MRGKGKTGDLKGMKGMASHVELCKVEAGKNEIPRKYESKTVSVS